MNGATFCVEDFVTIEGDEYCFSCWVIHAQGPLFRMVYLVYKAGFFFVEVRKTDIRQELADSCLISELIYQQNPPKTHIPGTELLRSLLNPLVLPDNCDNVTHNIGSILFHNWLKIGNTTRRMQFFNQYKSLFVNINVDSVFHFRETFKKNDVEPIWSAVISPLIKNSRIRLDHLLDKISSHHRFFAPYPLDYWRRENPIEPAGVRVDRGDSSLSIMSDLLDIPGWAAKQLRRSDLFVPILVPIPTNGKLKAVPSTEIVAVIKIIAKYGDADFMSNLNVRQMLSLIVLPVFFDRENSSPEFSKAFEMKVSRDKLSKFMENWFKHKQEISFLEMIDVFNAVQKFISVIINEHSVDRNDMVERLSHHIPNLLSLSKWSDEWHKDIAPFVKYGEECTWCYDLEPLTFVVDGHSYVCKPITSTQEIADEGREQHHCVGTRNESCYQGQSIVFSIRGNDERSTLEYVFENNFVEHRTVWNGAPSDSLSKVEQMLVAHIKSNPDAIKVRDVKKIGKEDGPDLNTQFWMQKFSAFVDEIKGVK